MTLWECDESATKFFHHVIEYHRVYFSPEFSEKIEAGFDYTDNFRAVLRDKAHCILPTWFGTYTMLCFSYSDYKGRKDVLGEYSISYKRNRIWAI